MSANPRSELRKNILLILKTAIKDGKITDQIKSSIDVAIANSDQFTWWEYSGTTGKLKREIWKQYKQTPHGKELVKESYSRP